MSSLFIASTASSIVTIIFSSCIIVYTLRYAILTKPHIRLILLTQIANVLIQTGLVISVVLHLNDPENLQVFTILTAFQNYVPVTNSISIVLLDIEILKIFSIYDLRVTSARLKAIKKFWIGAAIIFLLPMVCIYTYLAIRVIKNTNPDYAIPLFLTIAVALFYTVLVISFDNTQAAYLLWLVFSKNPSMKKHHRKLLRRLVLLTVAAAILDWGATAAVAFCLLNWQPPSIQIPTFIIAGAITGIHPAITTCVFYGLQDIALHKVFKRKEAEKARGEKLVAKKLALTSIAPSKIALTQKAEVGSPSS